MSIPREPLPSYPDGEQAFAYATQGYGYGSGYPGEYGMGGVGYGLSFPRDPIGGFTSVAAYPKASNDPRRQIVLSSNSWSFNPEAGIVLGKSIDDVMIRLGPYVYELMMQDPVIFSTVEVVVLGILGDKHEVTPRVIADPGERVEDSVDGDRKAKIERAKKYADECDRMLSRLKTPFRETLRMTTRDKVVYGSCLSEIQKERVKEGPDAGKIMISAVQPKPWTAWAFVVDQFMTPKNIWGWTASGPQIIGLEKFMIQNWCPVKGDPRGTAILRPVYDPWNFKMMAKPYRAKFLSLFSDPTLILKYDSSMPGQPVYPIGADGREDPSQLPLSQAEQAVAVAANFHSASYICMPKEWEHALIEASSTGEAFDVADAAYNREIVQGILLSARATQEAQHNSKSDNEGATDYARMRLDYGRQSTCEDVEKNLFFPYVRDTYGLEEANELTPRFSLGQSHKGDVSTLMTSATGAGYKISPRQFPALDVEFNLPARSADEMDAMQAQSDAAAEAQITAASSKGAPPGDPASKGVPTKAAKTSGSKDAGGK